MLRRRVTGNALSKIAGEAGGRGAGMLLYILLARWLGAGDFGRYSFALSYASLFMVVVDLGTNLIITRELARDRSRLAEFTTRVNALKGASSLLTLGLIGLSLLFLPYDGQTRGLIMLMGLFVVGTGLLEYLCAVLSGLEHMALEAVLKTANKLLCLAGGAAGFFLYHSLSAVVAGILAGFALSLGLGYAFLFRLGSAPGLRWDWSWKKTLLGQSLPLITSWLFWNFYDNQDVVLLGFMGLPAEQVGRFAAAMKLIDVVRAAPVLLVGSVFPILSGYSRSDPEKFSRLARFTVRLLLAVSIPIAAGLAALSGPVVRMIYGSDYAASAGVLSLAAWAVVGIFLNHLIINLLVALDLQGKTIAGAAAAAGFNLLILLALTPKYGLPGAGAALVLSEAVFLALNVFFLRGRIRIFDGTFWSYLWKPAAAAAAMLAILRAGADWNLLLSAAAGAAAYAAALYLLRGIPARLEPLQA